MRGPDQSLTIDTLLVSSRMQEFTAAGFIGWRGRRDKEKVKRQERGDQVCGVRD
jgi:hypothetical protein